MLRQDRLVGSCLLALLPLALSEVGSAQATIRPLPPVARSWESSAVPAVGRSADSGARPAAVDLDFIGPPPLQRQPTSEEPPAEASSGPIDFVDVDFFALSVGAADFDGGEGQLTTQRGGWKASIGRHRPDGTSYAIGIDSEASFYDFSGGLSLVPDSADPFNDVYETSLSGRFLVRRSEKVEWYGGAQIGLAGEDRAKLSDATWVGGALALRYQAAPQFALLAGLAGVSRFEDSP